MTNWFALAILLLAPQAWNTSRTPSVSSKQTVVHPGPHFILQTKLCIPTQPLMGYLELGILEVASGINS